MAERTGSTILTSSATCLRTYIMCRTIVNMPCCLDYLPWGSHALPRSCLGQEKLTPDTTLSLHLDVASLTWFGNGSGLAQILGL